MSNVNEKLDESIIRSFETLKESPLNSEEHETALKELDTLYKLKNEADKTALKEATDWENLNNDRDRSEGELEMKQKQLKMDEKKLKHEKRSFWIKLAFMGAVLVGTMKFEENGYILPKSMTKVIDKVPRI